MQDSQTKKPLRRVALPLDADMLHWLEDWTPPFENDGPPLTIADKIFAAVCIARLQDMRGKKEKV